MDLDLAEETDSGYLSRNLFCGDDWAVVNDLRYNISDFQDEMPSGDEILSGEGLLKDVEELQHLGFDLHHLDNHMFNDDNSDSSTSSRSWLSREDENMTPIDACMKDEPPSPSLSLGSSHSSQDAHSSVPDYLEIKLESPPLTPPHDDHVFTTTSQNITKNMVLTWDPEEILKQVTPFETGVTHGECPPVIHNGVIDITNGNDLGCQTPINVIKLNNHINQGGTAILKNGVVLPSGYQLTKEAINGNSNGLSKMKGIIVGNKNGIKKVVLTNGDARKDQPSNGIHNALQTNGTAAKRTVNGHHKKSSKQSGTSLSRKGQGNIPKRDANGVTIHPPIVPKPDTSGICTSTIAVPHIPGKTIVVTQANFPNCTINSTIPTPQLRQQPQTLTTGTAGGMTCPVLSPSIQSPVEESSEDSLASKRLQRMIKNRESACQSRRKKKEHLQNLEQKVCEITAENEKLKQENIHLRQRVKFLEDQVEGMKSISSLSSNSGKAVTCLFAIVLLLGVNLVPFSIFTDTVDDYTIPVHHGRALLSFDNNISNNPSPSLSEEMRAQYYNETLLQLQNVSSEHLFSLLKGNPYLKLLKNSKHCDYTEDLMCEKSKMRLVDVLKILAAQESNEKSAKESSTKISSHKKASKLRKHKRRKQVPSVDFEESEETSLQVYDSLFFHQYENLLKSLNPRDDTFYIVSFTRDHLLLPATAHNSTLRPRMSLVMPAASSNDSSVKIPKDHMTMMQIDCEVMNTKTVVMPDSRAVQNDTYTPPPKANKKSQINTSSKVPTFRTESSYHRVVNRFEKNDTLS